MRKVLILGGSGFLGRSFVDHALQNPKKYNVFSTFHTKKIKKYEHSQIHFNFSNEANLNRLIKSVKPDIIINSIALANIEECQINKSLAMHLNATLPSLIAKICSGEGICNAHISTDHLFAGDSLAPYNEESSPDPLNFYAESKLVGEQEISTHYPETIIARTNFFGGTDCQSDTFFQQVLNASNRNKFGLFDDVFFSPLSTNEVALTIFKLLENQFQGLINISSRDSISKYNFGNLLLASMQKSSEGIFRRSIEDVSNLVLRPKMMSLSNKKLVKSLGKSFDFSIKNSINNALSTIK